MRHTLVLVLTACFALALLSPVAAASVTIDIFTARSVSIDDSPNKDAFGDNSIAGIENGGTATGTSGTPGYFNPISTADARDLIETPSFNSWRGNASPTGSFANEHGNELAWGVHIQTDDSTEIRLSDLQFEFDSTDDNDWFDRSDSISGGYTDWLNGKTFDEDDNLVDKFESGNADTFVDEIVGLTNTTSLTPGSGTGQSAINSTWTDINDQAPFEIQVSYTLQTSDPGVLPGKDKAITVQTTPVPTPGAGLSALVLIGTFGCFQTLRRKRRNC